MTGVQTCALPILKVVDRGYALVTKGEQVIKIAGDVKKGDLLNIRLSQGSLQVSVETVKKE